MIELLLFIAFSGLILASYRHMKIANPYQIYFLIWFLVFLGYYFSENSFIKVPQEFLMIMLVAKSFVFSFLIIIFKSEPLEIQENYLFTIRNKSFILLAQIAVFLTAPLAYQKAVSMSGGSDIFSVTGYRLLRYAMTLDGQGFEWMGYLFILAFVLSSISVMLYLTKSIGKLRLTASIAVSLFYAFLSTGRTYVLLLTCLILIPLILINRIQIKGIFLFLIFLIFTFMFTAGMADKGVSVDVDFSDNINSILENVRAYTIAPFLALFQLINSNVPIDLGGNTFRIFFAIAYYIGLTDVAPVSLIRDYVYVPDATNVYTVYETYFRDFSYLGLFIPPLFLAMHWWLYRKAIIVGNIWIYYYAASVYPLLMQFFQDQYFSLLSMWIQIAFWYWLFLNKRKVTF